MHKSTVFIVVLSIFSLLSGVINLNLRSKQITLKDYSHYIGSFDGHHVLYNMSVDYNVLNCIKYERVTVPVGQCASYSAFENDKKYGKDHKVHFEVGIFESIEDGNDASPDLNNVCIDEEECENKKLTWKLIYACGGNLNLSQGKQDTQSLLF